MPDLMTIQLHPIETPDTSGVAHRFLPFQRPVRRAVHLSLKSAATCSERNMKAERDVEQVVEASTLSFVDDQMKSLARGAL